MSVATSAGSADASAGVAEGAATASWDGSARRSLAALAMTVFALVFSEFLPAGLLTPMARDLAVSVGAAGQAVTITAVAGMVSALFIGLVVRGADRKIVMVALCGLAVVGNGLSVIATDFAVLLVARAALGLAIGGFWALSAGVVGRLVPAEAIGRSMGLILIGVSVATITAPPAGAFIAAHWGWRSAMALASAVSSLALLAQFFALPRLPAASTVRLRTIVDVVRRRAIAIGLLAVVAIAGGHFCGFTYIRPVLQDIGGLDPASVAAVLLGFGLSNFVGNLVGTAVVDRFLRQLLGASAALIGLSSLGIFIAGSTPAVVISLVCLWGFAFGAAPVALQTWMARAAPDQLESVGSVFIATFQVAIATGAAAGGAIVDRWGIAAALAFAGTLALLAILAPMFASPSPLSDKRAE